MRALLKIVLILASVALAAGGTFYFAETRLGPPRAVEKANAHLDFLEKSMEGIVPTLDIDSLNRLFFRIHHQIGFLDDDSLLACEDSDRLKVELVKRYGEVFTNWCMERFHGSEWEKKQLVMMKNRSDVLKNVKRSDGVLAADADALLLSQIDSVLAVIKRHDAAKKLLSGKLSFVSMSHSQRMMDNVNAYRHHDLLKNDEELMEGLKALPEKMELLHYEYLCDRVDHMKEYPWMKSMENVEKLYDKYLNELNEYEERAYRVYGRSHGVGGLRKQLEAYRKEAEEHWEPETAPERPSENRGSGFHFEIVREGY